MFADLLYEVKSWLYSASFFPDHAIAMCFGGFGFASSLFGMTTFRMPFSYLALIFSLSTVLGNVNDLLND
jgi:hypothetical protein